MANKKTTKAKKKTATKAKAVPINWHVSDNIISRYANNVLVDILENEFKLSFFELKPEFRLTPTQPLQKEVQADCVANIIMSPTKIPALIAALKQQYDQYVKVVLNK